jgi:DNA-binding NtrC family response regulator
MQTDKHGKHKTEKNNSEKIMKTILLVDDEPDILVTLADMLGKHGYTIIARRDAESALSLVREGTPIDLVITDLRMPGMSGSELTTILRQTLPSVPIIMLTGYGSVETYLKSMSSGVFEYVNKPVQARELRRIVKTALEWSRAKNSAAGA